MTRYPRSAARRGLVARRPWAFTSRSTLIAIAVSRIGTSTTPCARTANGSPMETTASTCRNTVGRSSASAARKIDVKNAGRKALSVMTMFA